MQNIIQPSVNCWQVAQAEQASFIIDGAAYYRALHEAMATAQHSIIIVGWDLHSNVELIREKSESTTPSALGAYLDYLVRQTPQLNIYLLSWDFSMIYAMEREFFPRYKLRWRSHDRIHFCLDGEHPAGASQHQKIVVIDDAVAFSGGLDLSKWRWDTPDHLPENTKRLDPEGKPYPPFHDVQLAVTGEAAASLGELVRYRWQRCGGEEISPPASSMAKAGKWPKSVPVHLRNIPVAVARTFPPQPEHGNTRSRAALSRRDRQCSALSLH